MNSLEHKHEPKNISVQYGYFEHTVIYSRGFRVVDATATGPRAHDDLIWLGDDSGGGKWLTPAEALHLSESIRNVVASHTERHDSVPNLWSAFSAARHAE